MLLAAFLLFQVQLLLGRLLLPRFGGAPAVWITSLLFFQTVLLLGYAYAHSLVRWARPRTQAIAHGLLLAAAGAALLVNLRAWSSPLLPPVTWSAASVSDPAMSILRLLAVSAGLPCVALAATAPLLQAWYAGLRSDALPYRLYALSNLGSLAGLLSYVLLVEPQLPLRRQALLWSLLFAGLAAASLVVARAALRSRPAAAALRLATGSSGAPPTLAQRGLWLWLALAGSACLLAITNQICQEIAVLPLLWVLPLAIYLVTYALAFAGPRWRSRRLTEPLLLGGIALAGAVLYYQLDVPVVLQIAAFSLTLFACCLACHGELARLQPPSRFLTSYYLSSAAGGALGGAFVALAAPRLFRGLWELHASLLLCATGCLFALLVDKDSWLRRGGVQRAVVALAGSAILAAWLVGTAMDKATLAAGREGGARERLFAVAAAGAALAFLAWRRHALPPRLFSALCLGLALALLSWTLRTHITALTAGTRFAARDFFAAVQVREVAPDDASEHAFWLVHGRIVHGFQYTLPAERARPTSYYSRASGLGLAIRRHPLRRDEAGGRLRIGVLGLGVGTVAAHADRGDTVRFYEISPAVIRLAQGEGGYFTYLRDSPARIEVVEGDARVALEDELRRGLPQRFDVLVLDAFASGAVPVHLLTREAFRTYMAHLAAPHGILAINVSNRTLDLSRVVWRLAAEESLAGVSIESDAAPDGSTWHSLWILLSRDRAIFDDPTIAALTMPSPARSDDAPLWTDEHSSLLGILRPEAW